MATKVEAARERLHDQDFYAWTRQQAALLRAKRFTALDLDRLVEAVEEMGDSQREAALGNARVVLEHLLVLAHSAAQDPRNGWRAHPTRAPRPARVLDSPQLRQALHDKPALVSAIAHRNGEGALAITASRSRSMPCPRPDQIEQAALPLAMVWNGVAGTDGNKLWPCGPQRTAKTHPDAVRL